MTRLLYLPKGDGPPDALFAGTDGKELPGWLDPPGKPGEHDYRYVFADVVASWLGTPENPVKANTVMVWTRRYPACPQPVAQLAPDGRSGRPRVAWPDYSLTAFRAWRETLPGRGTQGNHAAKGRHGKTGPAVRALIGAGVADEVLSAFPYRAPIGKARDKRDVEAIEAAAGGRLIVTGAGDGRVVRARDQADADAAAAVMPGLVFERESGGDGDSAG